MQRKYLQFENSEFMIIHDHTVIRSTVSILEIFLEISLLKLGRETHRCLIFHSEYSVNSNFPKIFKLEY